MGRDIVQRALVVGIVTAGAILSLLPTVVRESFTEKWFTKPMALGLDISGGVHLVYQVKASEAVKSQLQASLSGIRAELRARKIAVIRSSVQPDNTIQITLLSESSAEPARNIVAEKFGDLSFVRADTDAGQARLVFGYSPQAVTAIEKEAVEQAIETLRNRVDSFGVAEPLIQSSGQDRIILQMPGVSDIEAVKRIVGNVAKLEFRLVPTFASSAIGTTTLRSKTGETIVVEDQALMSGDAVSDARVNIDQKGEVQVSLKLTPAGGQTFARITSENVGRQLAIILNGVVTSAPVIREPITDGSASISGSFTMEEARELKFVLKSGALPAPLEIMEERFVGPTLGVESVKKGLLAMAIGFVTISVFMMFYYLKSGMVAVATLVLNALLMLGCLSLFGATLTLPGLAGLALTIGMAVDSNVIIFERIRDEIRKGASRDLAVHTGFHKAFGAIFDSNVTTLLAGAILYYFGTGAIRGFAVTLSVGIATTLFCAVYVARLCFDYFEFKGKEGLSI